MKENIMRFVISTALSLALSSLLSGCSSNEPEITNIRPPFRSGGVCVLDTDSEDGSKSKTSNLDSVDHTKDFDIGAVIPPVLSTPNIYNTLPQENIRRSSENPITGFKELVLGMKIEDLDKKKYPIAKNSKNSSRIAIHNLAGNETIANSPIDKMLLFFENVSLEEIVIYSNIKCLYNISSALNNKYGDPSISTFLASIWHNENNAISMRKNIQFNPNDNSNIEILIYKKPEFLQRLHQYNSQGDINKNNVDDL